MSSTASINTIPFEVLIDILSLLLPTHHASLELVCKGWRDVLYNIPYLWTTVTISSSRDKPVLDVLEVAVRRAKRTGVLPLKVTWDLGLKEEEITDDVEVVLADLFRNAPTSRWKSLILRDSSGFSDDMIENLEFPSLEQLEIQVILSLDDFDSRLLDSIDRTAVSINTLVLSENWEEIEAAMPYIFQRVRHLEIQDFDLVIDLPENIVELTTFGLPLDLDGIQHLTHLTIDRMEPPRGVDIQMLALQYLDVGGAPYNANATNGLSFPNLVQLHMPSSAPFLLARITAPKLKHLQLDDVWTGHWTERSDELSEDGVNEHYRQMFESNRFPSSITSLTLASKLEAGVFAGMMKKTPDLQVLDVSVQGSGRAVSIIEMLIRSLSEDMSSQGTESKGWTLFGGLTFLTLRMNQGISDPSKPLELRDRLEELCRSVSKLLNVTSGLESFTVVWPDGAEEIIVKGEGTKQW